MFYLLYSGCSDDGTGTPRLTKMTECKEEARKHFENNKSSPYCFGYVAKIEIGGKPERVYYINEFS